MVIIFSHKSHDSFMREEKSISCADFPVKGHSSPVPVVGYLLETP